MAASAERILPGLHPQGEVEKKLALDSWHEAREVDVHF